MQSERYLSLYIGNHGKTEGIEDYITIITDVMKARGIHVRVATGFDPNAVNLVIDEFTNYLENHRIAEFRIANPQSKIVYILTEFTHKKWGVESLNHFGGIFDAAAIALVDVYLRIVREDFYPVSFGSVLKLILYSPLLALQVLFDVSILVLGKFVGRRKRYRSAVGQFRMRYHRKVYFHMRYLGLKACLQYADAVIVSHETVFDGVSCELGADGQPLQCFGVVYPELDERDVLDKLMVGKKPFIEITGSLTPYRKQWIRHIDQQLLTLGMHHVFGRVKPSTFSRHSSGEQDDRGAFSIHPPQTRTWPYCSPTRIYRALSVDYNLPILTNHFHQNPIEDVCLIFEGKKTIMDMHKFYNDPHSLKEFIEKRVRSYNKLAKACNDKMTEKLRELIDDSNISASD